MKITKTHYFYKKPVQRLFNKIYLWLNDKGIIIHWYGYILYPYTFWKRLFSFKWVFYKIYNPISIRILKK